MFSSVRLCRPLPLQIQPLLPPSILLLPSWLLRPRPPHPAPCPSRRPKISTITITAATWSGAGAHLWLRLLMSMIIVPSSLRNCNYNPNKFVRRSSPMPPLHPPRSLVCAFVHFPTSGTDNCPAASPVKPVSSSSEPSPPSATSAVTAACSTNTPNPLQCASLVLRSIPGYSLLIEVIS